MTHLHQVEHAHEQGQHDGTTATPSYLQRGRWVFIALAAIAAGLLIAEHRAHVISALPYLIILACPLMHMFMHGGGHGGHGGHGAERPASRDQDRNEWEGR